MSNYDFVEQYLWETQDILATINKQDIEQLAVELSQVRDRGGRLFVVGIGGSSGSSSHITNDLRKICNIETYCPTDNVSELTARANDDGLDTIFSAYLQGSHLTNKDAIFVLSVGGGNAQENISVSLIKAVDYAKSVSAKVFGIIGRDGGYTKQHTDACVIIPPLFPNHITPHSEGIALIITHLLVSHPLLKMTATKWESIK